MFVPPSRENRRAAVAEVAPIVTVEPVVAGTGAEAAPTRRGAD
jgi:hypothetical protein